MLEPELFALLEHTDDAAYAVTVAGEIRCWNHAAERLFGHTAGEAVGRNVNELLEASDTLGTNPIAGGPEAATRVWAEATGGIPNFDMEVRTRSGSHRWVNVSTVIFDNPRTHRRLLVRLAHDIDQRKRNEMLFSRFLETARQVVAVVDDGAHYAPTEPLSERERRILKLFAAGGNSSAIARAMGISPQTLRNHLHHINRKLRTHNRLEAVTHALRRGLLDGPAAPKGK